MGVVRCQPHVMMSPEPGMMDGRGGEAVPASGTSCRRDQPGASANHINNAIITVSHVSKKIG